MVKACNQKVSIRLSVVWMLLLLTMLVSTTIYAFNKTEVNLRNKVILEIPSTWFEVNATEIEKAANSFLGEESKNKYDLIVFSDAVDPEAKIFVGFRPAKYVKNEKLRAFYRKYPLKFTNIIQEQTDKTEARRKKIVRSTGGYILDKPRLSIVYVNEYLASLYQYTQIDKDMKVSEIHMYTIVNGNWKVTVTIAVDINAGEEAMGQVREILKSFKMKS